MDGACKDQCDCGATNPCGEYIFDHRGGTVDGRTFSDWYVNEYMITSETLLHKNPQTGEPQPIGLGWLDDAMRSNGPTEEDQNYIADTGASNEDMQAQVVAYQESMLELKKKAIPMGGYWWQLMDGNGMHNLASMNATQCKTTLRDLCVPKPRTWNRMQLYNIPHGGKGVTAAGFTDYTAEFLLTRGPYAILGYSWYGCTNGQDAPLVANEWGQDFGEPIGGAACVETFSETGIIFERKYSKATVQWDCDAGQGKISQASESLVV